MARIDVAVAVAAVTLLPASTFAAEPITRLSLDEAVMIATQANPTLRAKEFETRATRAGEVTAGLRPNPTGSFAAEHYVIPSDIEYTVALSQTIETGGKRQRRLESARAATRVAEYDLADTRRQVVYQVKKAFSDVLVAKETLDLAERNLKTLDEVERLQRIRVERGDLAELELNRIQVQRYQFERDAADARQAVAAGKIALRTAVGRPDVVAEDFDVAGQLTFKEMTWSRNDLYRFVIQRRPDVLSAAAAADKARAEIRLARANAWWDITPQVEYQRIGPYDTIGFGFSIPIRIFDRNQGEIARTMAGAQRAEEQRQATTVQALSEVDTALTTVQTSATKVKLLHDTYLPIAQRVRETVEFAYRRGGLSLLDFLDAERSYRQSALEYFRSLGDYWTAVYQLESAVGGSLEH